MSDLKNRSMSTFSQTQNFPKLNQSLSTSKLFQNKDTLLETKKIFINKILHKQQEQKNQQNENMKQMKRSLIQFPKMRAVQGFLSFNEINKSETKQILADFTRMRSKSTHLKPFIKAQIIYNQKQIQKIEKINKQKQKLQKKIFDKKIKELTPIKMKKQIKIKQKYQSKSKRIKNIQLSFNFKAYDSNLQAWKPYIDYDSLPIYINGLVYFIAGRKVCPAVVYNILQNKWKQLSIIDKLKPFGDCGASIINDDKIFCFGGYNYFQQGFSMISNSFKIVNVKSFQCQVVQFCQKKVAARAFHHQCLYGKYIVISGGEDKDNKLFNNFMTFHYQKRYWNELSISQYPKQLLGGFAKHQTIAIFHKRKVYSIYNDQSIIEKDPHIKQEGIYLFGGQDANGVLISKMFIMKLGTPSVPIVPLAISGTGPIARRNFQMIRQGSYIIIHGGRNDEMNPFVLNSISFLSLKNLEWIHVSGQKPPYRYSHSIATSGNQIVILGGKNIQGLCKQVHIMPFFQLKEQQ